MKEMEVKGYERDETGFAASLDDYIKDKKWKGVKFSLGNITGEGLEYYLRCGVLDNKGTENILNKHRLMNLELCLPEEKVLQLVLNSIPEENRMDFQTGSHPEENCRDRLEQICNSYPQLLQKTVGIIIDDWSEFVRVEDRPMDEVVAWMLNIGTGFERLTAKYLLKECLHLQENEKQALLGEYKHLDGDEGKKEWFMNLRLPSEAGARFGAGKMYVYEKGTMNYAVITDDRQVEYHGGPMSPSLRDWIDDTIQNRNVINDAGWPMFRSAIGEEVRHFVNKRSGAVEWMTTISGNDDKRWLLDAEGRTIPEGWENSLLDVTGRVTDVKIRNTAKPTIVCRIDGVQQMGRPLTDEHLHAAMDKSVDKQWVAEKYYTARLMESQERNQKLGR